MWKSSLFILVSAFLLNEHLSSGDMMQCVEAIEQLPGEILEFPIDITYDIIELIRYRLCNFWILTDVVVYFTDWCDVDEIKNTTEPTTSCGALCVVDDNKNATEPDSSCPEIVYAKKPKDCYDVLVNGANETGVYKIWPINRVIGNKSIDVYCDMDTDGGGWTVLLKKNYLSNEVNFTRNWIEYKNGFGDFQKDFWIGNDNMYALSNQAQYEVRFDLKDYKDIEGFDLYGTFWIEDEEAQYRLHIEDHTDGNVTISAVYANYGIQVHNLMKFSTYDVDNDNNTSMPEGCAAHYLNCGWWYSSCCTVCLTIAPKWSSWGGRKLVTADMKLRPKIN